MINAQHFLLSIFVGFRRVFSKTRRVFSDLLCIQIF